MRRTIAYHEAGHATVSWLLEHASPLLKGDHHPQGQSAGAAWYLPEERSISTREHILDELAYALGGRAAEELVIGKISTGALSDLEKVTKQAYAMVAYFGMSDEVGNISFYDSSGQSEYGFTKPYSENGRADDSEAKKIVEESYLKAKEVIASNMARLTQLAEQLLEEVIFSEDLERIFGKRRGEKHAEAAAAEASTAGSSAGESGVAGSPAGRLKPCRSRH